MITNFRDYTYRTNYAPECSEVGVFVDKTTTTLPVKVFGRTFIDRLLRRRTFPYIDLLDYEGVVIAAGGAVRDWFDGKHGTTKDLDLFFRSPEELQDYKEWLDKNFDVLSVFENEFVVNMLVLWDGENTVKVQLIKSNYFEDGIHVVSSFDLSPCQFAIDINHIYVGRYAAKDLKNRRLRVNRITFPLSTLKRICKYSAKGFFACHVVLTQASYAMVNAPGELRYLYMD